MDNVHGLDVYERKGNEDFPSVNATVTVSIAPTTLLDEITACFDETVGLQESEHTAVLSIALSKIAREPLAEAVLCISALELLSTARWTGAQREALKRAHKEVRNSNDLSEHERKEVLDALQGVLKYKSIGASVKQKMRELGFTDVDVNTFLDVYKLRSDIFHGSIMGRARHVELGTKARDICARVVLRAAGQRRDDRSGS